VAAPCRYSGFCGGCTWQFLRYEKQLEYKRRHVAESLEHIAAIASRESARRASLSSIMMKSLPAPCIFVNDSSTSSVPYLSVRGSSVLRSPGLIVRVSASLTHGSSRARVESAASK